MNLNVHVTNPVKFQEDANALAAQCNAGGAFNKAIGDLKVVKNNLEVNWTGAAAKDIINNIITVHNAMIEFKKKLDDLATLANEAAVYADRANHVTDQAYECGAFAGIDSTNEDKMDVLAKVQGEAFDIKPAAADAKSTLETIVKNLQENVFNDLQRLKNSIFENWTVGAERETFESAFQGYLNNFSGYYESMNNACSNIKLAFEEIQKVSQ